MTIFKQGFFMFAVVLITVSIATLVTKTKKQPLENLIETNVIKSLSLCKVNYPMTVKRDILKILFIGEKIYNVDHKDVLAIIMLESNFRYKAINRNKNKSADYGLTQQNSNYIKWRYVKSASILKKYNIEHNIKDKYDVRLNLMSAIILLEWNRITLKKKKIYNHHNYIAAYNVGITGLKKLPNIARKYYLKFLYFKTKLLI